MKTLLSMMLVGYMGFGALGVTLMPTHTHCYTRVKLDTTTNKYVYSCTGTCSDDTTTATCAWSPLVLQGGTIVTYCHCSLLDPAGNYVTPSCIGYEISDAEFGCLATDDCYWSVADPDGACDKVADSRIKDVFRIACFCDN